MTDADRRDVPCTNRLVCARSADAKGPSGFLDRQGEAAGEAIVLEQDVLRCHGLEYHLTMRHETTAQLFAYPMSLRPGVAVPIPAPQRSAPRRLADGFLVWGEDRENPHASALLEPRELPMEFVFHELWDLDLPADWTDMTSSEVDSLLTFAFLHGALPRPHSGLNDALEAADLDPDLLQRRSDSATPWVNHIADVVAWLSELQRCARHLDAAVSGDYTADVWDVPYSIMRWAESLGNDERVALGKWDREELAHHRFCERLNLGLKQYTAGVERPVRSNGHVDDSPKLDLYGAGCLMIHNLLLEEVALKHCAKDNCQRPFFYQRNPDRERQPRSRGVKYCTTHCGDAQRHRNPSTAEPADDTTDHHPEGAQ